MSTYFFHIVCDGPTDFEIIKKLIDLGLQDTVSYQVEKRDVTIHDSLEKFKRKQKLDISSQLYALDKTLASNYSEYTNVVLLSTDTEVLFVEHVFLEYTNEVSNQINEMYFKLQSNNGFTPYQSHYFIAPLLFFPSVEVIVASAIGIENLRKLNPNPDLKKNVLEMIQTQLHFLKLSMSKLLWKSLTQ